MYRNIGAGSDIAPDLKVSPDVTLVLGDYVSIGPGVRIIGEGTVKFGDYSKIHGGCFISVPHPHSIVQFGCNTWIGERSVLDGRGRLIASHNVGVGIGSHLYTHIAHGDVMAGCKFMSEKPLNIGMDAWFVGQCLVSPVEVGEKSIAMLGSTITKDMLENTIYAGVPAKDMTEKMGRPWEDPTPEERLLTFERYVAEFCTLKHRSSIRVKGVIGDTEDIFDFNPKISYFNVVTRTYTKKRHQDEIEFLSWLTSWKARFVPEGWEE